MAEVVRKPRAAVGWSRPGGGSREPSTGPRPYGALFWALPPVALLALFFLYPLALVVQQSFQPDSGGTSLQPYADVFASYAFREALWTTVWLAAAATVGCLVLGFVLALVIAFVPFPGARAVSRFIDVFLSFPSFLITLALLFVYGSVGMANGLWTDATGASEGPFQFLTTPWGVLLAEITYFTPFVVRPLLAAFSQLDTAQLEAASSLGPARRASSAGSSCPRRCPRSRPAAASSWCCASTSSASCSSPAPRASPPCRRSCTARPCWSPTTRAPAWSPSSTS